MEPDFFLFAIDIGGCWEVCHGSSFIEHHKDQQTHSLWIMSQ